MIKSTGHNANTKNVKTRVPLSDQTNVFSMKRSNKPKIINEKVVKNGGNKLTSSKVNCIKPILNNTKFSQTTSTSSAKDIALENIKETVRHRVKPYYDVPLRHLETTKKHLSRKLSTNLEPKETTNQEKHVTKSLKIILTDILKYSKPLQYVDNKIFSRGTTSKSTIRSPEERRDIDHEALNSHKCISSNVILRDVTINIDKNHQVSQKNIDSKKNKATLLKTKLNPNLRISTNISRNYFDKNLKIILTDCLAKNSLARKRSKSLCVENFAIEAKVPEGKLKLKSLRESQTCHFIDESKSRDKTTQHRLNPETNKSNIVPETTNRNESNDIPVEGPNPCYRPHAQKEIDTSLKVVETDHLKCRENVQYVDKRRIRSKSLCLCTSPLQNKFNLHNDDLKVDKHKSTKDLLREDKKLDVNSYETKLKSVTNSTIPKNNGNHIFDKSLRIILTEFQAKSNIGRRRSKSLTVNILNDTCVETCIIQDINSKNTEKRTQTHFIKNTKTNDPTPRLPVDTKKNTNVPSKESQDIISIVPTKRRPNKELPGDLKSKSLKTNVYKKAVPSSKIKLTNKQKTELPKVAFKPCIIDKENETHNLRRLEPKNYIEESILECTTDKPNEILPATDLIKMDSIPIYRKILPEVSKIKTQNDDLYEFTDFSPKPKKNVKNRRPHGSSILFDKDTHEILRKLEEKEAKAKKKVVRNKKKLEKEKCYDKIVGDIVSNVFNKISKKTKVPVTLVEKAAKSNQNVHKKNTNLVQNKAITNDSSQVGHSKTVYVNDLHEELNIDVSCSTKVTSSIKNVVPEVLSGIGSDRNITTIKGEVATTSTNNHMTVTTRKPIAISEVQSNSIVNFLNMSDIEPILLQSIGSCDNSVSQKDIDSCFGFEDVPAPIASTPASTPAQQHNKNNVNILGDIVIRAGSQDVESPIDFNVKRPNANSTMLNTRHVGRVSNPWRPEWVNVRHNPHFLSVKSNALPRIDQEMVLDHTLVESFEKACSKTPRKQNETPIKKPPVQQSMLDFVDSNIEKECEILQSSLYDYEAFNSPEKKKKKEKIKAHGVKRNLLGDENCIAASTPIIVASTPVQRRPLADISNSPEKAEVQNVTYFGFEESSRISPRKTPEKHKKENDENDFNKPSRFDINKLKSYTSKRRNAKRRVSLDEQEKAYENLNKSVSIFEATNGENVEEIHLFEEPEEMLDNMSPVHIDGKRQRRKRQDSCDSDSSDCGKTKKHKKTKLEIEKDAWIKDFNKMCEEVDKHELELD